MNICFALPDALYGGIHTLALNLGRQFALDGHRVSAVISARGVPDDSLGDVDELKQVMEVHVCAQERVRVRSRFLHRVINAIEAVKPDVIILNHTLWGQAALPYLDSAVRRVVVVHGLSGGELELPRGNSPYWDAIVAVGPSLEEKLLREWNRDKVYLIPVGVPDLPYPGAADFADPVLKVCFVGRVIQGPKNVFLIPRIAGELVRRGVRTTWTIVGDGSDLEALVRVVDEAGLEEMFEFVGACGQANVQEILARQHLLILPSHEESISHVVLEAQMLGVVPVASRLPGATDFVISSGESGLLCDPGRADSFADAIASLNADRPRLARLSSVAKKRVRERFQIAGIAARYYSLFNQLQQSRRGGFRSASILGWYAIPRVLLPSRFWTSLRVAKSLLRRALDSATRNTPRANLDDGKRSNWCEK